MNKTLFIFLILSLSTIISSIEVEFKIDGKVYKGLACTIASGKFKHYTLRSARAVDSYLQISETETQEKEILEWKYYFEKYKWDSLCEIKYTGNKTNSVMVFSAYEINNGENQSEAYSSLTQGMKGNVIEFQFTDDYLDLEGMANHLSETETFCVFKYKNFLVTCMGMGQEIKISDQLMMKNIIYHYKLLEK